MDILSVLNNPERRAEQLRRQDEMRAQQGHKVAQSPAQANYLYGLGREQQALDQLQAIRDGEVEADDERRSTLYDQLAEGLALQGKFDVAASIALDGPHKEAYRARADALASMGSPRCACPATMQVPNGRDAKGDTRETRRKIEEVWDAEGERVVAFFKCESCGTVSAEAA